VKSKPQVTRLLGAFSFCWKNHQQNKANPFHAIEVRAPFAYNSRSLKTMFEALSQWN